jgi:hypothetical protein
MRRSPVPRRRFYCWCRPDELGWLKHSTVEITSTEVPPPAIPPVPVVHSTQLPPFSPVRRGMMNSGRRLHGRSRLRTRPKRWEAAFRPKPASRPSATFPVRSISARWLAVPIGTAMEIALRDRGRVSACDYDYEMARFAFPCGRAAREPAPKNADASSQPAATGSQPERVSARERKSSYISISNNDRRRAAGNIS